MTPFRCSVPPASTYPSGSVNSTSVWNISHPPSAAPSSAAGASGAFDALVGDLQAFNGEVVVLGVEGSGRVLDREGLEEVPAHRLLPGHVQLDDGDVAPDIGGTAGHDVFEPEPEAVVGGVAVAKGQVAVLGLTGQLARSQEIASLAVLDDVGRGIDP